MKQDTRLRVREPDVAAKVIDGEAVIINLATGMYYSLNGPGSAVWELIERRCSLAEASDIIARKFSVAPDAAHADVARLWDELLAEQLVTVSEEAPAELPDLEALDANAAGSYSAPALTKFEDMVDLFAADPPLPELPALERTEPKGM